MKTGSSLRGRGKSVTEKKSVGQRIKLLTAHTLIQINCHSGLDIFVLLGI